MKRTDQLLEILATIIGILCLAYLLIAAWHVRAVSDDFFFFHIFSEKGWFFSAWDLDWNKRWTTYLIINTVFLLSGSFSNLHPGFFIYYILTIGVFVLLMRTLVNLFFRKSTGIDLSLRQQFTIANLLVFSFFLSSKGSEVWFWFVASAAYLWPAVFFTGLLWALQLETRKTYIPAIIVFALLLGGTAENFVFTAAVVLLALMALKKIDIKKALLAISLLAVLPLAGLLDKGMLTRFQTEKAAAPLFEGLLFADQSHFVNLPKTFAIFLIMLTIGYLASKRLSAKKSVSLKTSYLPSLLLGFAFLATFLPLFLVFGNAGPARSAAAFQYVLVLFLSFKALWAASWLPLKKIRVAAALAIVLLLGAIPLYTLRHYRMMSEYTRAWEQRNNEIINSTDQPFILVRPLPNPGPLASQEPATSSSQGYNVTSIYLPKVLGIDKYVILEDASP
jgi:hypothetical protein